MTETQPVAVILKVRRPRQDPNALWLVFSQHQKHRFLKTKAQIPTNVQRAVALSHGKAHFNATVTGQSITWGTEALGQKW